MDDARAGGPTEGEAPAVSDDCLARHGILRRPPWDPVPGRRSLPLCIGPAPATPSPSGNFYVHYCTADLKICLFSLSLLLLPYHFLPPAAATSASTTVLPELLTSLLWPPSTASRLWHFALHCSITSCTTVTSNLRLLPTTSCYPASLCFTTYYLLLSFASTRLLYQQQPFVQTLTTTTPFSSRLFLALPPVI